MKKRLLFVMETLRIGGAEKSLVTLLSQLDYSKYDVDLVLFQHKGEFLTLLPKEVRVLNNSEEFNSFTLNPRESIRELIKRKKFKLLPYKFLEITNIIFYKFIRKKEYIGWNFIKKSIEPLQTEDDVAIGFLEKRSIYFTVDRVKAKKKVGWIHIDYEKIEHNHKMDNTYFEYLDNIVTVSEHCKEVLVKEFPRYEDKILYIQNIISPNLINNMANDKINEIDLFENNIVLATVCRLTVQKGLDLAVECCEQLVKKGFKFKWILVGEGSEREKLQNMIKEKNLEDTFILMGSRSNPYPYMKMCDIYVQPSRWEGFGITVAEAKVLNKPIVVSNIPEFAEQIEDNKTGFIYKDSNEMVNKIGQLITDSSLKEEFEKNLKKINMNNSDELKKFEKILEG